MLFDPDDITYSKMKVSTSNTKLQTYLLRITCLPPITILILYVYWFILVLFSRDVTYYYFKYCKTNTAMLSGHHKIFWSAQNERFALTEGVWETGTFRAPPIFFSIKVKINIWDEKISRQKIFVMLIYEATAICLHF